MPGDQQGAHRAAHGSDRSSGFAVRRAYEAPEPDDGYRVLVDGMWPRGVSKQRAELDEWLKAVAPSQHLRHDLHDGRTAYRDFVQRYEAELDGDPEHSDAVAHLQELVAEQPVTLITAVKDQDRERSHIPVLLQRLGAPDGGRHNRRTAR